MSQTFNDTKRCYKSICVIPEFDEITKTDAHKEHIAQYKDNIESAVSAQFNDIVEEVS